MSEEVTHEKVQDSHETKASNNQESPSEPNYKQEMMKYKTQRNEEREEKAKLIAEHDQLKESGRQKKLAEEGKYKELDAEKTATIDKLNAKLESQTTNVSTYKQNLVDGLTSDDERKEYLSTKPVDFLEELTKEKNLMQPQTVSNPGESLGAVRKTISNKPFSDMTEAEKRDWHKQMTNN